MKKMKFILMAFSLIILVLFSTLLSVAGCAETTPKQLDIYVWEGYVPEEVAALFEQETGIKLNTTFISDNEMMLTLLKGGGRADIVMPTQTLLNRFYEEDTVQPLDLKTITNYEKVSKSLREQPWAKWNGNQMGSGQIYAIPYVFGTCGLAINTSRYTKSLDNIGWEVLFDTDLIGRVSTNNNIPSLWLICSLYNISNEDIISDPQGTLDKIEGKAIELKNNVLKFWDSGSEIIDLMKNEEVWVSFIDDGFGRKLSQFDPKFKYVLPQEGGMGWTDTLVIPKNAVNPVGANLFIDYMLSPDIAAMVTEQSGFSTTVKGALDLTEGIDKNLYSFTDEQLTKLKWYPNLSEEVREIYLTFWEEITTIQ